MDDDDSSSSTSTAVQTLAGALLGGLGGYLDAQNAQPVTATIPSPQTAYGYAGTTQTTPTTGTVSTSTMLLLGAVAIVAVLLLRKA